MRSPQTSQRLSAGGSFLTPLRSQCPFSGSSHVSVSPLPYSRRRLNGSSLKQHKALAQPTQNFSIDARDRIARTLSNVLLPVPSASLRELPYEYTDQLVDTAPLETFHRQPPTLKQAIAEYHQANALNSPTSNATSTRRNLKFGICTDLSSIWYVMRNEVHIWHWQDSVDTKEETSSADNELVIAASGVICGVAIARCKLEKSVVANLAELKDHLVHIEHLIEQLKVVRGKETTISAWSLCVVTENATEKYILVGNSRLGAVDFVPLRRSRVSFDGNALTAIAAHSASERFFLADKHGAIYEYNTVVLKEAYFEVNFDLGGRLQPKPSSTAFGGILSNVPLINKHSLDNKISTTATVKKLIDIRTITSKLNIFGQAPCICRFAVNEGDGRIYALSNTNDVYVLIVPPPIVTTIEDKNATLFKLAEQQTLAPADALMTWEALLASFLEFLDSISWEKSRLPRERTGTDFASKRNSNRLKESLAIASISTKLTNELRIVLTDGSRCTISCQAKSSRSWARNPNYDPSSLRPFPTRVVDNRIWKHLNDSSLTTLADAKLSANFTFARLPPPGLAQFSNLKGEAEPSSSQHMRVVDAHESLRGGGLVLMETETSDDGRGRALLAMAEDPSGSSELVQWVHLKGAEGGSARWFEILTLADLPLEESQAALEVGLNAAETLYSFHRRLSLGAVAFIIGQMGSDGSQTLFPLCILADSFSFGPLAEALDFLTAVQILPGTCVLSLTADAAFTTRRRTPRAFLRPILPLLDQLTSSLVAELTLVSRVPSMHQRHIDSADTLLQNLRELTGQPLPGLAHWARLLSKQRDTATAAAASLFALDRKEHTLDELWSFVLGRQVLEEPSPYAPDISSETIAYRLIVLIPALHSLCDLRVFNQSSLGGRVDPATDDSDRLAALKRTLVRVQYPFSSQPLFAVEGGLVATEPCFGRLPAVSSPTISEETRHIDIQQETEPTQVTGKRRLTNGPQDYRVAKQGKFNSQRQTTPLPTDYPLDLRLRLRFSEADLSLGQSTLKALVNAIDNYSAFLHTLPPDLKAKTADDIPKLTEIRGYVVYAIQVFSLLIIFRKFLQSSSRELLDLNVPTADDQPIHYLPPTIFDRLSRFSFEDLLQDVLSSERPSLLHEWMNIPGSELTTMVSAASLFADCHSLFTPSSLLWAAACEPLRALTQTLEKCESERRQVLHERITASRADSETETARASPTSMLEYLWSQWKEKEPALRKDLQRALPLPRFLEANPESTSLLLFDATTGGMKKDLAKHVVIAIVTAVTLVRVPSKEAPDGDLIMKSLLELLFDLHAFDALAIALAVWAELLSRPILRGFQWMEQGSLRPPLEQNQLPSRVHQVLQEYFMKLKAVSDCTDGWLGRDLADDLAVQLTRRPLPSLVSLWAEGIQETNLLSSKECLSAETFIAAFDSSRPRLETSLAHATFLWMVCYGRDDTFPRSLSALRSPHLGKWLDSVAVDLPQHLETKSTQLSSVSVAIAVADFFLKEKSYHRAIEQYSRIIMEQPRWLTFPMDISRLSRLSASRLSLKPKGWRSHFPCQSLSCLRRVVSPALAGEFRNLFLDKWMSGLRDDWSLVERLSLAVNRLGDLPIRLRAELLNKAVVASQAASHASTDYPSLRDVEVSQPILDERLQRLSDKIDKQIDLLDDLLEFACLLIVGDGDACAAIVQTVHEFDGRETPKWKAIEPLHRTLVQNLLNFLIVSAHVALPSVSAIFDSLLDFLVSLKGFIPMNCSLLLEIWSRLPEDQRKRLNYSPMYSLCADSGGKEFAADCLCVLLPLTQSVEARLSLLSPSMSLGIIEDLAIRHWNHFASISVRAATPFGTNGAGVTPLIPGALFFIVDRALRRAFQERPRARALDEKLAQYFTSAHTEKLDRVNHASCLPFEKLLPLENFEESPIGCLSAFAVDVTLRVWLWDLVGLTRDGQTGERLRDLSCLAKDPERALSVFGPAVEWLLSSLDTLLSVLGIMLNTHVADVEPRVQRDASQLVRWLDLEMPLRAGGEAEAAHMTTVEVAHAIAAVVMDILKLVSWMAPSALPCLEESSRLSGNENVITLQQVDSTAEGLTEVNVTRGKQRTHVSAFLNALATFTKSTSASLAGDKRLAKWRDLADGLISGVVALKKRKVAELLKDVLREETNAGGWQSANTRLLQLDLQKMGRAQAVVERELFARLNAYRRLMTLTAEQNEGQLLFGGLSAIKHRS